jgi:N-acetylgalactosamine kinase
MEKAEELKRHFKDEYPEAGEPQVCRAPGRINLLGEHVDYNGLPVLPMATQCDIRVAFAPRTDGVIRMRDRDAEYPPREFRNAHEIAPSPTGCWDNYCKAAIQGLNRHFEQGAFPGMDMFVSGDIPVAVGLSSSSALVVVCALAYLRCLGKELEQDISRLELAAMLAEAEHYVGTQGGGMDQAIILLGKEGTACKISFGPLRTEDVPLLEDHVFVACNSLVKAKKTGDALHRYNAGPLTCRLARALVEKKAQEEFGEEVEIDRLADLWYGPLALTYREVADLFRKAFPKERMTLAEAARLLDLTPEEIRDRWLGNLKEPEGGFRLQARARHQLTEFTRVEAARDQLLAGDAEAFGALMNASHESCATDYAVSCPELDALVEVARKGGALGSRLTGAGFGGCTVNLVPKERLAAFCENVTTGYYEGYLAGREIQSGNSRILVAHAAAGAGYA